MDLERAGLKRFLDLNELKELRNDAYLNSKISKEISKKWHDQIVVRKHFQAGDKVLLYDSKLHLFPRKIKSRWIGHFTIHQLYPNEAMELLNSNESQTVKVNRHRLKQYAVCHTPNPRLGSGRGTKLYWDSLPAFSNIGGPKSYN